MGGDQVGLRVRCKTENQLHNWLKVHARLEIPRLPVCANHSAPWEYIRRAYFEPAGDLVVWAPRGGGKTTLGAIATLLDLLHKPACQVRILGGSLEQSLKMWEHLYPRLCELADKDLVKGSTARRIELKGGAGAAILTQSQRAVRGLRVQKLRCDEVELFQPDIWEAAQLATRSARAGDSDEPPTAGCIEALSTLHRPFGLMQRIIEHAEIAKTPILRWCLMDVLEPCPPERECASCALREECNGIARTRCHGYIAIDDAIRMKGRVSRDVWNCEMLCLRPSTRGSVFPEFDPDTHVREMSLSGDAELTLSLDFGFSAPFVCLWIATQNDGRIFVIDEYVRKEMRVHDHLREIASRPWPPTSRITCDPAGSARNEQTARSNVQLLRAEGYNVKFRGSRIADGVALIAAAISPAHGPPTLFIHPRCGILIKALRSYRYASEGDETPLKDGEHDHLIDALRYFFVNRSGGTTGRNY